MFGQVHLKRSIQINLKIGNNRIQMILVFPKKQKQRKKCGNFRPKCKSKQKIKSSIHHPHPNTLAHAVVGKVNLPKI